MFRHPGYAMIELEFSRPIAVDRLGHDERTYDIEANPSEREALTRRMGVLALDKLSATVILRRKAGNLVRVRGRLQADVVQACVVSLEPVPAHLEEEFELVYAPEDQRDPAEVVVDMDVEDPPEVIVDGVIDIGEATAEHLALALDPFPRAPGAQFEGGEEEPESPPKANPFASLAGLKKK